MNSYWYQKENAEKENGKNAKNESMTIDLTDDSESFVDHSNDLKNAKLRNFRSNKNIEVANIKQLPTLFFIIFIVSLALVMTKFIPHFYSMTTKYNLYTKKLKLKYIPEVIGDQSLTVKALIITSQFILMFIIICLTSLIKQRFSVPELKKEIWRNYMVIISSLISVVTFVGLTYYNPQSLRFSHNYLKLSDNILFIIFSISTFILCYMTYMLLAKLNIREIPKDCACLMFKKYLILLMGIQVICYLSSTLLVSTYNPVINLEKYILSCLIISSCINSFVFLFCQAIFIFSLKYDLYYVNMNLQIRPDLEYFLDLDECNLKLTNL